jgi:hypothetical protein
MDRQTHRADRHRLRRGRWPCRAAGQGCPNTVVSLTFDDGHASQYATLNMLQSKGMVGTYFINSAMVGTSS